MAVHDIVGQPPSCKDDRKKIQGKVSKALLVLSSLSFDNIRDITQEPLFGLQCRDLVPALPYPSLVSSVKWG